MIITLEIRHYISKGACFSALIRSGMAAMHVLTWVNVFTGRSHHDKAKKPQYKRFHLSVMIR